MYELAHQLTWAKCHKTLDALGSCHFHCPSWALNSKLTGVLFIIFLLCVEKQNYNNGTTLVCLYVEDSPTIALYLESYVWKTMIKPTFFINIKASVWNQGAKLLFILVPLAGKVIYFGNDFFKVFFTGKHFKHVEL